MLAEALEAEVEAYIEAATGPARRAWACPGGSQWLRQGARDPLGSRRGGGEGSEGQRS